MRRPYDWSDADIPMRPRVMTIVHPLSPLNVRCRLEFLAAAEEEAQRRFGRSLTVEELERVLRRYPGDIGSRAKPLRPWEGQGRSPS